MSRDRGFTLVELLVVVVVLGVLAGIAMSQYQHTRQKAFDASAKSDLRNLISAQETYLVVKGEYAEDLVTVEAETRFNRTEKVEMSMDRSSAAFYRADAKHEQSSSCFFVEIGDGADQEIARVDGAGSGSGQCGG